MLPTNNCAVVILITFLGMKSFIRCNDVGSGFELKSKHANPMTVSLRKCCKDYEFYVLGLDKCHNRTEEMSDSWPPSVYERGTNRKVDFDSTSFIQITNSTSCSNGDKTTSSTDFHLNIDGTVTLQTEDKLVLQPNDFCVNQIMAESSLGEAEFVVRYCIPDPCKHINCVRKCCPSGMAFVDNNGLPVCQVLATDHSRFDVVFRDNAGHFVSPNPQSYLIHHGNNVPKCPYGATSYSPEESPENLFHIQPDGRAYITYNPQDEKLTTDYCIDDYFLDGVYTRVIWLCYTPVIELESKEVALRIFPYFLFLSSIFLIATFIVYAIIPEIRNIHGVTIMCFVASLAVTYIVLGIIQTNNFLPPSLCISLAVVGHFSFLSTFTWLNVLSFDIWRAFYNLRPHSSVQDRQQILGRYFFFASIYGWGVPLVIVLVGQILDNTINQPSQIVVPQFGVAQCWFFGYVSFWAYLYGPMAVFIIGNIVLFITTAILLNRASIDVSLVVSRDQAKQKFRVIFSLLILTGVSWITEVISFAVAGSALLWIFTDILNILTGVFVFVIFVMKPKIWQLLKLRLPFLYHLDRCCPSFMKRSGTVARSFRSNPSSSVVNPTINSPNQHVLVKSAPNADEA